MSLKLLVFLVCWTTGYCYNTIYMSNRCEDSPYLISYDADKIWYAPIGYNGGTCVFTIKGDYKLILKFQELDSSFFDAIDIFDGSSVNSPKLTGASLSGYDLFPNYSYRSSGAYLTIRFRAFSSSDTNTGFRAVATQVLSGDCSLNFKCCDGDCIESTLRNDGVDNCRDSSDEWAVSGCLHIGALVGIIVGISLFSFLCILLIVCFVRRRRYRRAQTVIVAQSRYPNYSSTSYVQPAPVYNQVPQVPQVPQVHQVPQVPQVPQGGAMQPPPYSQYSQQQTK